MTTKDKTGDQLMASIRKAKTDSSAQGAESAEAPEAAAPTPPPPEPRRNPRPVVGVGMKPPPLGLGISGADRYAGLQTVNLVRVTGRAYSWMADRDCYNPGGSFIKIPNSKAGSLGGNRFFTLKERKP